MRLCRRHTEFFPVNVGEVIRRIAHFQGYFFQVEFLVCLPVDHDVDQIEEGAHAGGLVVVRQVFCEDDLKDLQHVPFAFQNGEHVVGELQFDEFVNELFYRLRVERVQHDLVRQVQRIVDVVLYQRAVAAVGKEEGILRDDAERDDRFGRVFVIKKVKVQVRLNEALPLRREGMDLPGRYEQDLVLIDRIDGIFDGTDDLSLFHENELVVEKAPFRELPVLRHRFGCRFPDIERKLIQISDVVVLLHSKSVKIMPKCVGKAMKHF